MLLLKDHSFGNGINMLEDCSDKVPQACLIAHPDWQDYLGCVSQTEPCLAINKYINLVRKTQNAMKNV